MTEILPAPLGITSRWQDSQQFEVPDPLLKNWLLNTGSLTERLQTSCRHFQVKVLFHGFSEISDLETQYLYNDQNSEPISTQVREVVLMGDDSPWVFARSLIPASFVENVMSDITQLGDKPLGKIIFNDPRFERQAFQLTKIDPSERFVDHLQLHDSRQLWGRRSLFRYNEHRLSVAEVFLPDSPAYSNMPK